MVDTVRTRAELAAILADNTSGDISAQDLRDLLASLLLAAESPTLVPYKIEAGRYTSNGSIAAAATTTAGAANRMEICPWVCPADITVDQFAMNVTTGVASALGKVVVYSSDVNGRPDALLLETGTLDFSSTGQKTVSAALTLRRNTLYYIGVRYSSTATVSAHPLYVTPCLGHQVAALPAKGLRRTLTFATAAPSTWGYLATEENASVQPIVWMRAA